MSKLPWLAVIITLVVLTTGCKTPDDCPGHYEFKSGTGKQWHKVWVCDEPGAPDRP
jgi:hypothetical protein